jgi:hypothetical protein
MVGAALAALLALPALAGGVNKGVSIPAVPTLSVPSAGIVSPLVARPVIPAASASLPSLPGAPKGVVPAAAAAAPALKAEQKAQAGKAIAESGSVEQALAKLVEGGLLKQNEVPSDATDKLFLLRRLWDGAAPSYAEGKVAVDASWAVPALKVEKEGTTYLIHPVAHGQLYPPNKRSVLALVKQIEKSGGLLLSEEGLPAHYGFSHGLETLDHRVNDGQPLLVDAAAQGYPAWALKAVQAGIAAVFLAPLLFGLKLIIDEPTLLSIIPTAAYAAFLAVIRTGLLPYYRLRDLLDARAVAKLGADDQARQYRREANALHKKKLDPLEVLRLHLPPGPGAEHDSFSARSEAMAGAAVEQAAAVKAKVVHVLAGYKHAAEIGWRLRSHLP